MALVGLNPRNHPQQVKARGPDRSVDERFTPNDLYAAFDERYHFTLDVAATATNCKTQRFYDLAADGLHQPWAPERVWCNPPYSNIPAWMFKAHQEFNAGCAVIVMLLPANRPEQKWWQQFVEPHRDRGSFMRTQFIARRRNFAAPGNEGAVYNSSPPFGLVAVIFEKQGDQP